MKVQDFNPGSSGVLPEIGTLKQEKHYYEPDHLIAVVAAWYAEKPLLVVGEPGVGKSQLARAVAHKLNFGFLPVVVRPGDKYQDLLWEYDAVARLADAQLMSANKQADVEINIALAKRNYIHPGPLWWAYHPKSAKQQSAKTDALCPVLGGSDDEPLVLLVDEIDKADSDLPNGLLDVFANEDIELPLKSESRSNRRVLTIITSNGDRPLPPAFMRRCLVLDMRLPNEKKQLTQYLRHICEARGLTEVATSSAVVNEEAELTITDQCISLFVDARHRTPPSKRKPSVAEFLDLLNVVIGMGGAIEEQRERAAELQHLILDKSR